MENIYSFLLDEEEYEKVLADKKQVHLFVNSNKYKSLAVGNEIEFICEHEDRKDVIEAIIENILYFPTVIEAIESLGKEKCGYKNSQTFDKASDLFLSDEGSYEQIEKYGIGAILFKIIAKN